MKRLITFMFVMMTVFMLSISCSPKGEQEVSDGPQEITIWYLGNEFLTEGGVLDLFKKSHPNIKINYVAIPNSEYVKKLTPVLKSGKNVPDIFVGEANYVKQWVESPYWDDLSTYSGAEDSKNLYEYVVDVGTAKNGSLKALAHQATPGVIAYRRSIMQEFFGVSKPEDVAPYLDTIDAMINTAKELQEKSDGKYKLFTGVDAVSRLVFASRTKPWVNDKGQLEIGNTVSELLKLARLTRENGYEAGVKEFSPAYRANLKKDGNILAYVFSTWGIANVIRRNGNDEDPAKNSLGDWGVVAPKAHYFWGGTWLGIYKKSKNKQAAWEFIKTLTMDEQFVEELVEVRGDFPSNKNVVNSVTENYSNENIGGQNTFEVFSEEAEFINGKILTKYDFTIEKEVLSVAKDYANISEMTLDEAIAEIKKRIKNAYPKLSVK